MSDAFLDGCPHRPHGYELRHHDGTRTLACVQCASEAVFAEPAPRSVRELATRQKERAAARRALAAANRDRLAGCALPGGADW